MTHKYVYNMIRANTLYSLRLLVGLSLYLKCKTNANVQFLYYNEYNYTYRYD